MGLEGPSAKASWGEEVRLSTVAYLDVVLEEARKASDSDERATLYREALEMIVEDSPKVMTSNVNEEWVLNAGLEGLYPTPQRVFPYFKNMGWKA